jgi:hypothetical protein
MRPRLVLPLVVALAAASGCRAGTLTLDELDRRYPLGRQTTIAAPGLRTAIAALRASVGGSPVMITGLSLRDGSASVTAQDPRVPENYDHHIYDGVRGTLTRSPATMRAGDEERMARRSFDLDSVPIELVSEVAHRALVELPFAGARVSSLAVHRSSDGALELRVDVVSSRRSGVVTFDAQGTVLSAQAN